MRQLLALSSSVVLLWAHSGAAQTPSAHMESLQTALRQNDMDRAMKIATALYQQSDQSDDHERAGYAAYVMAGLLNQTDDRLAVAETYEDCAKHYAADDSLAQSIQCDYQSAQAYLEASRKGQAVSKLRGIAKQLERIGQEKSMLASQVYLTLAKQTLPAKTKRGSAAQRERRDAAAYADKALIALRASDQDKSQTYAATLYLKGLALEDAEEYPEAVEAYESAVSLYRSLPDSNDDELQSLQARLSIARAGGKSSPRKDAIDVVDQDGRIVTLSIKKRKRIRSPRINDNQIVDGARASVAITLDSDGAVETVTVVDSRPSHEFGDAMQTAIESWTFIPPQGVNPEELPAFEYSTVFFVRR
ncbi:TonB family protein [Algimonas porphyrae]|uniref:TonB C-terminal domain-containing protein n=1 Tax=Algimonas porphyrae TaxID=1128113 RepID=A0ABQ5V6V7_9PROT|nr:energy transducer TonB [Algimonas porphyrae]GLQ21997.1 hypothetical protein GCM10007854_29520 [Algimonas porphyrae]